MPRSVNLDDVVMVAKKLVAFDKRQNGFVEGTVAEFLDLSSADMKLIEKRRQQRNTLEA